MTKKQREDLERRQARLAQMGIQIGGNDNDGKQQKKKRVVYGSRKNRNKKKEEEQEAPRWALRPVAPPRLRPPRAEVPER